MSDTFFQDPAGPLSATTVADLPETVPAVPPDDALTPGQQRLGSPDPDPVADAPGAVIHMPVDLGRAALIFIALLLGLYALRWASEVVIPILMSILICYALAPSVDRLVRIGLPRALAAAIVLGTITGAIGWGTYALSDQANSLIESLPDAAKKLRSMARGQSRDAGSSAITQVQQAAVTLEQAAADSGGSAKTTPGVAKVQIVKPAFNIQDYLLTGTMRAAEAVAQVTIVTFITYFLLASGDTFRRKLARIAGPSLGKRRVTVQALDEISEQVQRYLLVQLVTSIVVGVVTGLAFLALGVANAAVWGVLAGVLNLIPYVGTVVICAASAVVALMQFGTLRMALAVAGVSIILHVVSGYLVTPWLTSRTSRLNAVVVFIGVLAWGWLWGVWGLLLGTPILMALKAVCDRVDELKPIGELLGGTERREP